MNKPVNNAVVMTGPGSLEIRQVEFPALNDDGIILKTEYAGICGSDMHLFQEGRSGSYVVKPPFIQGHEVIGTVYAVGADVKHLKCGDRVVLEPGIPCGKCEFCRTGRSNLCRDVVFPSAPPYDGFFRQYVSHPAFLAHKVPDDTDMLTGVLAEPLSIVLRGMQMGEVGIGKTVVILGAGCIGLLVALASKKNNARKVIVSDVLPNRLEAALKLGADHIVNAAECNVTEEILRLTNGEGSHIVYETAGSKVTVSQTSQLVRRGGRIVLIGNVHGDVPFNFRNLAVNEAEVKTLWRYGNCFKDVPDLLVKGWVDKMIITRVFDYKDAKNAFDFAINKKDINIKTVLKMT